MHRQVLEISSTFDCAEHREDRIFRAEAFEVPELARMYARKQTTPYTLIYQRNTEFVQALQDADRPILHGEVCKAPPLKSAATGLMSNSSRRDSENLLATFDTSN